MVWYLACFYTFGLRKTLRKLAWIKLECVVCLNLSEVEIQGSDFEEKNWGFKSIVS